MLFLGLGTGLGSTMIVDGIVEPMEWGHLPYRKGTYEDYVGIRGFKRVGKKKWRYYVEDVVAGLVAALLPDDVVFGGERPKVEGTAPRVAGSAKMRTRSAEVFAYGRKLASGRFLLVERVRRDRAIHVCNDGITELSAIVTNDGCHLSGRTVIRCRFAFCFHRAVVPGAVVLDLAVLRQPDQ